MPEAPERLPRAKRRGRPAAETDGPAYQRIAQVLRRRIATGALPVGAQLPTEDELIEDFHVSRHTVRAAMQVLVSDDLIDRQPGRGTFVRAPAEGNPRWSIRSVDDLLAQTARGRVTMLDATVIDASSAPDAAISLRVDAHEQLYRVRVRRLDGSVPVTYTIIDLPLEIGRQLPPETPQRLETEHLLEILEKTTGRRAVKMRQISGACLASSDEAQLLDVPVGAALLMVRNIFIGADQVPIETSLVLSNPARRRHVIELDRSA